MTDIIYKYYYLSVIFIYVYSMICYYHIFKKCGIKGYFAFIPIFNKYIEYKIFYSGIHYWLYYTLYIFKYYVYSKVLLNSFDIFSEFNLYKLFSPSFMQFALQFYIFMLVANFLILFIKIKMCAYTSLSFNKNTLFSLVLFFFNIIGLSILAFGKDEYNGNMYKKLKGLKYV